MRSHKRLLIITLVIVVLTGCLSKPALTVILTFDLENKEGVKALPAIISCLDDHNAKATFFVTGVVAERYPLAVRDLAQRSHEIGSHGYAHEFPIFKETDAALFSKIFKKSFEYEWERSVKTTEEFENLLQLSRNAIKNATGRYPRYYRSPILTPSYTKDMTYIEGLKATGFTIDSSLLRRYMTNEINLSEQGFTILPASFSDSELWNRELLNNLTHEHFENGYPLVIVAHPHRFTDEKHLKDFNRFLEGIEEEYPVRYKTIGEYASKNKNTP